MPELPEVQTVVNSLRPRLLGRTVGSVSVRRADIVSPAGVDLPALLTGRTVREIARRGKRIVFTLDNGDRFYVHLGMTGRLTAGAPATAPEPHTHLEVIFAALRPPQPPAPKGGVPAALAMRFSDPRRFGGVWWLGCDEPPDRGMGPEPLTLRAADLRRRLARTSRAVKSALLDQALIAGLGNIYVDESLFLARLHPLRPASNLTPAEVGRLSRAIKLTLAKAIAHRGSTLRDYRDADGKAGGFQSLHRVYDRAAQPCRRCRTPIQRIVLGGRSTHFCPKCQPPGLRSTP